MTYLQLAWRRGTKIMVSMKNCVKHSCPMPLIILILLESSRIGTLLKILNERLIKFMKMLSSTREASVILHF